MENREIVLSTPYSVVAKALRLMDDLPRLLAHVKYPDPDKSCNMCKQTEAQLTEAAFIRPCANQIPDDCG